MAILASKVTGRLAKTLHDIGLVRWVESEMWEAIDDAQNAILEARPDLFEVTEDVQLRDIGVRQRVPEDCYDVFDITYNLDDNRIPFSGITKTERGIMDRAMRNWMIAPATPFMEHWMQDIREKKFFWTYPPISEDPDTGEPPWVVMRYARRPVEITSATQELVSPDEMINSVYYFAMTRLLEKDEKFAGSPQAQAFLDKFAMTIGARTSGDLQKKEAKDENERD